MSMLILYSVECLVSGDLVKITTREKVVCFSAIVVQASHLDSSKSATVVEVAVTAQPRIVIHSPESYASVHS